MTKAEKKVINALKHLAKAYDALLDEQGKSFKDGFFAAYSKDSKELQLTIGHALKPTLADLSIPLRNLNLVHEHRIASFNWSIPIRKYRLKCEDFEFQNYLVSIDAKADDALGFRLVSLGESNWRVWRDWLTVEKVIASDEMREALWHELEKYHKKEFKEDIE